MSDARANRIYRLMINRGFLSHLSAMCNPASYIFITVKNVFCIDSANIF